MDLQPMYAACAYVHFDTAIIERRQQRDYLPFLYFTWFVVSAARSKFPVTHLHKILSRLFGPFCPTGQIHWCAMVEDKYIGLALAISSSFAIGTSFIITKKVRCLAPCGRLPP